MVNIQSKSRARRVVREAQAEANEQRAQRDRDNVDDMAAFLVARTRLAGVDECQAERVSQIGLEADRRRDEHRSECAAAVQRLTGERRRGATGGAAGGLDSAGVAVALADRVIRHALSEIPTDYRPVSLAAIWPTMATAAGSVWL